MAIEVGSGATDIVNAIDGIGSGGLTVMGLLLNTTPGQIILVGFGFLIVGVIIGGAMKLFSYISAHRGRRG